MPFLMKVAWSPNGSFRSFLADGPPVGATTTLGVVDGNGSNFPAIGDVQFLREGGLAVGDQGFLIERRDSGWVVAAQLRVEDLGEDGEDRWQPVFEVIDRGFPSDDVAELCAAYEHINGIPNLSEAEKGMAGRSFLPLLDSDFEELEAVINRHPVFALLEYDNPSSLGNEVGYDSRAGCSVGIYEVDGLFFVEWSAYEGSEFGWEEVDVALGPGQDLELQACIRSYLDLYSDTAAPDEEDFGLVNDEGPAELDRESVSKVGSVIFHCFDDSQLPGVEIWAACDESFVVTRNSDGSVLGRYADLNTIRTRLRSPHSSYRPYLVLPETCDWEAWD